MSEMVCYQVLVDYGADLEARDVSGATSLIMAVSSDAPIIVKVKTTQKFATFDLVRLLSLGISY